MILAGLIVLVILAIWWSTTRKIDFDANATTPLCWRSFFAISASYLRPARNPSSAYAEREAAILNRFRALVLEKLGKKKHVCIITSGASESNNLLVRGLPHRKIFCTPFEHKSLLESVSAENIMTDRVFSSQDLVSIMGVNNETGDLFGPQIAAARGIIHSDISQYFGKLESPEHPLDLRNVDCFSISLHKLGGPIGVGVLVLPEALALELVPQISGTQNNGWRGGTENISAIEGAIEAIHSAHSNRCAKNNHLRDLVQYFKKMLGKYFVQIPQNYFDGLSEQTARAKASALPADSMMFIRIPHTDPGINTVLVSFIYAGDASRRFCNIAFRKRCAEAGVHVSIGSACNTTRKGASHVLLALKLPFIVRCGVIRFSFGDSNTRGDIDEFERRIMMV